MSNNNYEKCFDSHCFEELNNIDFHMLGNVYNLCVNLNIVNEDSTIIDCGTNAGSFVKVLKQMQHSEKNIHCFEPHPVLSKVVKTKYPYVKMNEMCLGNFDGNIDINIPTYSVGLSSIIRRPVFDNLGQEINVLTTKCQRLDTYCSENNIDQIDFIKIDVEGAEKMVLEGASEMLRLHKIKSGIFEVGQTLIDANTSAEEICKILENYGYKINKNISSSDYMFYL